MNEVRKWMEIQGHILSYIEKDSQITYLLHITYILEICL